MHENNENLPWDFRESLKKFYGNQNGYKSQMNSSCMTSDITLIFDVHKVLKQVIPMSKYLVPTIEETAVTMI